MILLAGLALLYAAGFWLLEARRTYRNVGHGLVFVGVILFGASIFLVGQMYNVQAHDPLGFLLWSGGALLTTLFFRSKPAAGLFVITLEVWIVHELVHRDELGGAVFIPYILALYGLALYGLGTALRPWLDRLALAGAMRVVGFALAGLMTFALSFRYAHFGDERPHGLPLAILLVSALVALAAGALLVVRRASRVGAFEGAVVLAATGVVLLAVFSREGRREDAQSYDYQEAKLYPLLFVTLLAAVVVGALVLGAASGNEWLVNGAILLGGLAIIGHFLDTTWSRLPRSAAFVAAGVLTLALAAALDWSARIAPARRDES